MTTENERLARLDDYVTGLLPDAEASAFEEALFAEVTREEDADVVFLHAFARDAARIAARGSFAMGRTRAEIDQLLARGSSVFYVDLGGGGPVKLPVWGPDTELVVFHTKVDLRGFEDIDVVVERPDGSPIKTFRDITCDRDDGNVYAVCEEPLARMSYGNGPVQMRVMATRDGARQQVTVIQAEPAF